MCRSENMINYAGFFFLYYFFAQNYHVKRTSLLLKWFCLLRFSDLDGHHRHTVYDGVLPHPFAITVFEETVYWTDWNTRTVEKGNKYNGSGREALVNTTHRPFDIHVCHPYRQPIGEPGTA